LNAPVKVSVAQKFTSNHTKEKHYFCSHRSGWASIIRIGFFYRFQAEQARAKIFVLKQIKLEISCTLIQAFSLKDSQNPYF
jgi:hypothetical protein